MQNNTYSGTEFDPDKQYSRSRDNDVHGQDNHGETGRQRLKKTAQQTSSRGKNGNQSSAQAAHKTGQNQQGLFGRIYNFITNDRLHAALGIALILLAGYFVVSGLSLLRHGSSDQSVIVADSVSQIIDDPSASVDNIGGPVGAKASHRIFVQGLGIGSLILIVYMVLVGLKLLGVRKYSFWSTTFKSLILAITTSMVTGFLGLGAHTALPAGGYYGIYLNEFLKTTIGTFGDLLVNIMLVAIVAILYLNELTRAFRKYQEKIRIIRAKRIREEDEKTYRDDMVKEAMADSPIDTHVQETSDPRESEEIVKQPTDKYGEDPLDYKPQDSTEESTVSTDNVAEGTTEEDLNDEILTDDKAAVDDFKVTQTEEIEQDNSKRATIVKAQGPYDPKAELSRFRMPTIDLLRERQVKANSVDLNEQQENKERIINTLRQYGVEIAKIEATVGPTITLYEIVPAEGVRISSITRLSDDIALSLAAIGIRIIAPIPGRGTIGIEVPNKDPQTVSIRSILGSKAFTQTKCELPMAMGATISNDVYIADLAKMPHVLVAGATGQGKSVGLNTIIASLLYKLHPAELKFVLIDPKMVEFSLYSVLEKYYLAKLPDEEEAIVTDPNKAVDTLNSLCVEMDQRYALLKDAGCRSIKEYNEAFISRRLNPEGTVKHRYLPYIVMIVDEFADLMMTAGKAVETPIARIAQKARAVGMHMIIATQRPSTNVITGIIKANFPGRIGFRVTQMVDSRTILDAPGANQLIGKGDMLVSTNGAMERVQCAFIDTDEVVAICNFIQNQVSMPHAYFLPPPPTESNDAGAGGLSVGDRDVMFEEIARWVSQDTTTSVSQLQRRYSLGYNRAGKIMDQLEAAGIVGPNQGGKPRQVLMDPTAVDLYLS